MNNAEYQDSTVIQKILHTTKTIAIVGLSSNHLRASHFVGFYLQRHGYRIIPVNPRESEILGEKSYGSITEAKDSHGHIDLVNIFRDPSAVPAITEEAISVGSDAIWLQFSVISETGAKAAELAGLDVVMDKCLKVEHARFLGRMLWLGFNTEGVTAQRG